MNLVPNWGFAELGKRLGFRLGIELGTKLCTALGNELGTELGTKLGAPCVCITAFHERMAEVTYFSGKTYSEFDSQQ